MPDISRSATSRSLLRFPRFRMPSRQLRMEIDADCSFWKDGARVGFGATSTQVVSVRSQLDTWESWFRSPGRVLEAQWPPNLLERIGEDGQGETYRATLFSISLLGFKLSPPSVGVRVTSRGPTVIVQAFDVDIPGVRRVLGKRFEETLAVDIKGNLTCTTPREAVPTKVELLVDVAFNAEAIVPAPLSWTPETAFRLAATGLARQILTFSLGSFSTRVVGAFREYERREGGRVTV
ncbi:unnamed protein product [Vitrella brassicaformis CCMP3155]|uniref:Uncharacterized protein n=1 Tax=Vitrella brassicaformis (strain CCMP3155) TaxID=1169540 RepID=A0A0G4GFP8_VITBC|nr:unnamed protein product [Vitrella brassicaformis CCMP3155]|eukprot:CEM28352.1 unnamed protein product [Vitrella brassicaformis CCMP3155]